MRNHVKVALVLEPSGGGSGRHVLDLAAGLAAGGDDVEVIWSPLRADAAFVEALCALPGVRERSLPMRREVGLADVGALRALARHLRASGPYDVIHGHSSKGGALVRLLPPWIPGARIYTPHAFRTMDPQLGGLAKRVYGGVETVLSRMARRTIVVSAAEMRHARSLGFAERSTRLVVNGAGPRRDMSRAQARAQMGLDEDVVAVGFVGRLVAQKDPILFVNAVRLAQQHSPALVGVMIGDGALRAKAQECAAGGRIAFLGWQDGAALMNGLDILCMTSVYEAMPYTLIEALHAGLPVVSTAVGGVEETVIEGETGFVAPSPPSIEAIAAKLSALASDAVLRRRLGDGARELARRRTIETMVAETRAIYREVALGDL